MRDDRKAIIEATQQATGPDHSTNHIVTFGSFTIAIEVDKEGAYTVYPVQDKLDNSNGGDKIRKNSPQTKYGHAGKNQGELLTNQKIPKHPIENQTKVTNQKNSTITQQKSYWRKKEEVQTERAQVAGKSTAHRFLKIPPATAQWQTAVKKKKQLKTGKKKCFFCHRIGHIQQHCWQRISCHNCGRQGHKWSKCLYEPAKIRKTETTQNTNYKQHRDSNSLTNLHMEFIHGRPALGQMYCTTRTALNDENEYLSRVGLIVIIRGAPSPDFAWAVLDKMVQIHGGHPEDYQLAQATIAPYVINCPTARIRDAMVNRGLYTIPQLNAQFAVHQWRPRFGMGYDPSTHQVWVKIVSLPLQAWTNTEVTRFLQKFGHPINVLPFGRQGGHFRDITALVNTRHPAHIPLAYVYREGDYTTQVDVLILSWRQWENGYFPPPPPDSPPLAQNSANQVNETNPTPERQNQSSSGSAPSEPTIDYSSWSPRSNCEKRLSAQKGAPNLTDQSYSLQLMDSPQTRKQPMTWSSDTSSLLVSLHEYTNHSATKDQFWPSDTNRLYSLTHLYLISIPGPITFKSFTFLLCPVTTEKRTLCAARNTPLNTDLPLDVVLCAEEDARLGEEISPLKNNLEEPSHNLSIFKQHNSSSSGPTLIQTMGLSPTQANGPFSK